MRYIGMLLIVAAGIGVGMYYVRRMRRRTAFLQRTARLIQTMEQRMSYAAQPLAAMWRGFAADEMFGDFILVRQTVALLDEMPFLAALQTVLRRVAGSEGLTPTDHALLQEVASGCGVTGMEEQRQHLQVYGRLCREQSEEAAAVAAARTPVCRMMGIAGGIGTALLFL